MCLFVMGVTTCAAEMNPYEEIASTAQGEQTCLTLGDDSRSVSLARCTQTDHQQWIFVTAESRFYIKSKALGASNPAMCLVASQNSINMAACAGSGGTDYHSRRLWSREGSAPGLLSNKYMADLGKGRYLQRDPEGLLMFGGQEHASASWRISRPFFEEIVSSEGETETCMTLADDLTSVTLQKCIGDDHQQWLFTPVGSLLQVKSKVLIGSEQDRCLTAVTRNRVEMAGCLGAGGNDYQSKRLWRRDARTPELLASKYIGDLGLDNYLQGNESQQLVFGSQEAAGATWHIVKRYGHIRNVEKGQEVCLALADNDTDVEFAPCTSNARQDWRMSSLLPEYDTLTNRALAHAEKQQCLGAKARMIDCQGVGYSSERAWQASRNFNPSQPTVGFNLRNKYRADLGKVEMLGFSGNTLQMVPASQSDAVVWSFELEIPVIPKRPVVGRKKALLLHARYSDKSPTDFLEVQRGFFGSDDDDYSFVNATLAASGRLLQFTGHAVTDLDLGPRPTGCPSTGLRNQALELARQQGFHGEDYDYVAVEIPSTSCPWSGLAAMPGWWAMGNGVGWKPWMWLHEFGHSLGVAHGTALEHCQEQKGLLQVGGAHCVVTRSADPSDTMNSGGSRLYPIPYLYFAGWLSDEQFPEALRNGTYKMAPLFTDANAAVAKGLRLFRSDGSYLALEFRQPTTGFEHWPADDPFVNGVIVRVARFSEGSVSSSLVDTTPGSADLMKDAPLTLGKSIDDVLSGKRITVSHIDPTGATVEIEDIPGSTLSERLPFERSLIRPEAEPDHDEIAD